MFADVYRLRHQGEKLPKDRLTGIRGKLLVQPGLVSGDRDRGTYRSMTASVHTRWPQPFPGHSAATLYNASLIRLDERGFILVGNEVILDGLGANTYRQAWFCRPVVDSAAATAAPTPAAQLLGAAP